MLNKSKIAVFLFLLVLASGVAAQNTKLVKTKITDKISVSIPDDFIAMPEDIYARKYGAYRPPLAMFTTPDGMVDFGINMNVNRSLRAYSQASFKAEDLEIIKSMYKASIAAMHTEVEFIQEKVETINKRDFIVIEFVGTVKDEDSKIRSGTAMKQYSYLQYTIEDERVLVFNFTCPYRSKERWQATAQAIMQSAKVGKF